MKYVCYGVITGERYLGITEADSEKKAKEKAFKLYGPNISFCHFCSGECEDPQKQKDQNERIKNVEKNNSKT